MFKANCEKNCNVMRDLIVRNATRMIFNATRFNHPFRKEAHTRASVVYGEFDTAPNSDEVLNSILRIETQPASHRPFHR